MPPDPSSSLKRNQACLRCRKRKLKCDASKPHCGACVRSHARVVKAEGAQSVGSKPNCVYEGSSDATASTPPQQVNVNAAMDQLAQAALPSSSWLSTSSNITTTPPSDVDEVSWLRERVAQLEASLDEARQLTTVPELPEKTYSAPWLGDFFAEQEQPKEPATEDYMDVLWPGWSPDLPDPPTMNFIVETFFKRLPSCRHLLDPSRFLFQMSLPPTHYSFPHRAILHAICTLAAPFLGLATVTSLSTTASFSIMDDVANHPDFATKHCILARRAIEKDLAQGKNVYQVLRALVLVGMFHATSMRWFDGWLNVGMAARLVSPLGLYASDSKNKTGKSHLMETPIDDLDARERQATLWMVVLMDLDSTAKTWWAGCLDLQEITINLPSSFQNLQSPDLFIANEGSSSFCLHVKAAVLLGKVNNFNRASRRGPWNESIRFEPQFGALEASLLTMNASLNRRLMANSDFTSSSANEVDVEALVAQALVLQGLIGLHEPYADPDDQTHPCSVAVINAARKMLKLVQLLAASSIDLSLVIRQSCILAFFIAALDLLMFKIHLDSPTSPEALILEAEVQTFSMAFHSYGERYPVGRSFCDLLQNSVSQSTMGKPEDLLALLNKRRGYKFS